MICTYDGQWAIVWQEKQGHLEIVNSVQIDVDHEVYLIKSHLVIESKDKTSIAFPHERYSIYTDQRFLSPGDRISAIATAATGDKVAIG
jgi:hypothetical protein